MKILILGASGYVGGKLIPELLRQGHEVTAFVRTIPTIKPHDYNIIQGDAANIYDVEKAVKDIDCIYYFIHSMKSHTDDFAGLDKKIAENVIKAAQNNSVKRIIYLGALGEKSKSESAHLQSRHKVAEILRSSDIPLTEFRAAVIVGNGSASFEMIKYLVNRLPVMICPRWIHIKTQPIYINDVIYYLSACLNIEDSIGRIIDIGGPDVISYMNMMKIVAEESHHKRLFFSVPVLTPGLSSHWVNLVTPISYQLARSLIESVRNETVCENNLAGELFEYKTISFKDAVRISLQQIP